jgi:hypothetical protein
MACTLPLTAYPAYSAGTGAAVRLRTQHTWPHRSRFGHRRGQLFTGLATAGRAIDPGPGPGLATTGSSGATAAANWA